MKINIKFDTETRKFEQLPECNPLRYVEAGSILLTMALIVYGDNRNPDAAYQLKRDISDTIDQQLNRYLGDHQ